MDSNAAGDSPALEGWAEKGGRGSRESVEGFSTVCLGGQIMRRGTFALRGKHDRQQENLIQVERGSTSMPGQNKLLMGV